MRFSPVVVAAVFALSLPAYAQEDEREIELSPGESVEIEVEDEDEDEVDVEGEDVEEGEVEYRTESIGTDLPRGEFPLWAEARAGITVPTADFADTVEVGFGAGVAFGYYFSPAFTLFANLDWGTLSGVTEEDVEFPDQGLFNYYLALGYDLAWMDPMFDLMIFGGAGATTFYISDLDQTDTNFAVNFGLKFYLWFADQVALTLHGGADLVFLTDDLQEVDDADTRWLFPVHLGVAFRF